MAARIGDDERPKRSLDPGCLLSCAFEKTWIFAKMKNKLDVDFSVEPSACRKQGLTLICSLRGLAGLMVALRLSADKWDGWLKGDLVHKVYEHLKSRAECGGVTDDEDKGSFILNRWNRIDFHALGIPEQQQRLGVIPSDWEMKALVAVAEAVLPTVPPALRPIAGEEVVAPSAKLARYGEAVQLASERLGHVGHLSEKQALQRSLGM